jgi:hypothetical protein
VNCTLPLYRQTFVISSTLEPVISLASGMYDKYLSRSGVLVDLKMSRHRIQPPICKSKSKSKIVYLAGTTLMKVRTQIDR